MTASEPNDAGRRRQHVWIILPAYNEEENLPPLLDAIAGAMLESGLTYRVVLVDDGSRDRTAELARRAAEHMPLVLEQHEVNQGLGATIRDGLTKACELAEPGDVLVSLDADNTHNPHQIPAMVQKVREGFDVVIASRYRPGSRIRGVSLARRALSYWGGWLFRIALPIEGVRDYTCGYRAYRAGALADAIGDHGPGFFEQQGFQCMVDILLKLRRRPLLFTEVPLVLRYDLKGGESKMNVGSTIRDTLLLILKRRFGG